MIRILIVDDQNLVQQGIKSLLDRDMELKVIGTVKDGRDAVKQIAQIHPDIVLLDIEMPGMNGITTTKYINRVSPNSKVIILSSHEEKKYVTQALMAGAKGYLLKSSLMTDLKQAILSVNNGYSQIDSRLLAKVFNPQNIRVKKSKLHSEDATAPQKDLDSENSAISIPDYNDNQEENTIDNPKFDSPVISPTLSQDDNSESEVTDSENYEPLEEYQPRSTVSKIFAPKKETFAPEISDAVVLKSVDRDDAQINHTSEHQILSPHTQTTLTPVKEKSSVEQYKLVNISTPRKKRALAVNYYWKQLISHPKVLIHKPKINQLVSNINRYLNIIISTIARKSQQNLWWNIALVMLGIVIVVILGK